MRKKRIILFLFSVSVILLLIIGVSSLFQPKKEWSLSEEQKEEVMSIAIAYVEENYGTDYFINGNVTISSYTEGGKPLIIFGRYSGLSGETTYTYPMVSFIVPADLTQTGVSVHVLVDPEMGKVVKVWTGISHPIPVLDVNVSSLGEEDMNVTQGSTLQVNVTLTSLTDQELTIPFENLTLAGFNNTAWDNSIPQNKLFNYTFSTNQLVLQPHESKSTVVTLEIAEDAPLVKYLFYIELGNSQVTQLSAVGLPVRVTPKLG